MFSRILYCSSCYNCEQKDPAQRTIYKATKSPLVRYLQVLPAQIIDMYAWQYLLIHPAVFPGLYWGEPRGDIISWIEKWKGGRQFIAPPTIDSDKAPPSWGALNFGHGDTDGVDDIGYLDIISWPRIYCHATNNWFGQGIFELFKPRECLVMALVILVMNDDRHSPHSELQLHFIQCPFPN